MEYIPLAIVLLTGLCFTGLSFAAVHALEKGAATYGGEYSSRTARAFEDLFLFIPPKKLAEIAWFAAALVAVLVFLATGGISGDLFSILLRVAISVFVGGLMLLAPAKLLILLRIRRRNRFNLQLVDALIDMGNALRSGFSINQAIEHVVENGESPISEEFGAMLHQTRVGVTFEQALHNLDERIGSEDLSLVVMSIETARRTGGNLAEIFESISRTIRERLRIQTRIRTLTAQGRLQGIVLSLMPVVIGIALHFVQPQMFHPFLHSATGLGVLGAAAILILLGALSIRKIVNIDI